MVNYYKILGLNSNATDVEIKTAYRKLSKKYHPDMNDGDKFFEDRFREIQEAYEKLCDPEYRSAYSKFEREANQKSEKTKNYSKSKQKEYNNETNSEESVSKPSKLSQNIFFSVLIIIIIVVVKLALKESVRKNALEEIENTYTPSSNTNNGSYETNNDPNSSKNLDVMNLDSIPIYSPQDSTANSSIIEENKPSKIETQKWILEKLNNYSTNYTSCPSLDAISYGSKCITYSNYSFIFNGDYLEVRYNYDNRRNELVKIPLYDFSSILNQYSSITIFTKENTMIETRSDDNSRKVITLVTIGLKTETETDLVKRLEKAFKHLSTFYSKPKSNEAF